MTAPATCSALATTPQPAATSFSVSRAVTAAEIENPLAGFRREQLDDARPEIGNEARGFS